MARFKLAVAALAAVCLAPHAHAAPHIGMKLACKRYGEAWNSGNKNALAGVTTGDFAAQFLRMPDDAFARMPRGGGGGVLSSSKGQGSGTVTVSTSQGVMTFLVVGRGFRWTVADIYKSGDDGGTVSLKNYLDATLTAGEFITRLKNTGGTAHLSSTTSSFRGEFAKLAPEQLEDLRSFLPEVNRNVKPFVQFHGDRATVRVAIPNREPGDTVTFEMRREGSWRVDDYRIESQTLWVPSFKRSMPMIASIAAMRRFLVTPTGVAPSRFTTEGPIRDALVAARAESPFPLPPATGRAVILLDDSGKVAQIQFPHRTVHLELGPAEGPAKIDRMWVMTGDRWMEFAHLLAVRSQLRQSSFAKLLRNVRPGAALAVSPVVLTEPSSPAKATSFAAARVEAAPEETPETVAPAVAETAAPAADAAVQPVRYEAQPVNEYRSYRRGGRKWRR